ncbi:unnamed protein product [Orchesella dallaii]|uniref:Adipose-secreted signaling protein n=1 Tax=Orchesella dallaii TaxID=48710 RepID=A0ABP1R128_9HEXA
MDQSNLTEPTAALAIGASEPVAQTSPSLRSNRHAKRALRNSRVHFDEDGFIPPIEENPVVVKVIGEEQSRTVGVYLGFLQEEHKYEIRFSLPMDLCHGYLLPSASSTGDGVSVEIYKKPTACTIQTLEWSKGKVAPENGLPTTRLQISIELQLANHSMPIFEDKFTIRSDAIPDRFVHISISAKIMGKHMGTPSLKDGIKCIGHCPPQVDSDSDAEQEKDKDSRT